MVDSLIQLSMISLEGGTAVLLVYLVRIVADLGKRIERVETFLSQGSVTSIQLDPNALREAVKAMDEKKDDALLG